MVCEERREGERTRSASWRKKKQESEVTSGFTDWVASDGKGEQGEVSVFQGTFWERGGELGGGGKWSSHSPEERDLAPDRNGAAARGE